MRIRLPLRLPRVRLPRRSRVVAVQCRTCGQWRKPRHIRIPALVCRTCETSTRFQTWKPTPVTTPAQDPRLLTPGGTR